MTRDRRLIVALDVASTDEALRLVDRLPRVSMFKIGLELLLLTGDLLGLMRRIREARPDAGMFIDLKIAGDIPGSSAAWWHRPAGWARS